nr:hypothetical protein [Methanoculleus marisnigri]
MRRALLFSSPDEVYAITGAAHRFLAADQPAEIDAPCRVLIEPEGRNTLPAIVYGMTARRSAGTTPSPCSPPTSSSRRATPMPRRSGRRNVSRRTAW